MTLFASILWQAHHSLFHSGFFLPAIIQTPDHRVTTERKFESSKVCDPGCGDKAVFRRAACFGTAPIPRQAGAVPGSLFWRGLVPRSR